jgi:uncharacterized protein YfaP (DUF2135 family)
MDKKITYTRSLGDALVREARSTLPSTCHIISSELNKWAVVSNGAKRPMRVFKSQSDAVNFAKKYAFSKPNGEVVIHHKDGKVQQRIPFKV